MNRLNKGALITIAGLIAGGLVMEGAMARPGGMGGGAQRGVPERAPAPLRMDENGDGVISEAEFIAAAVARVEHRFERKDADGDGLLSEEEASAARQRGRFSFVEIDPEAMNACMEAALGSELEPRPTPQERFAEADADGDGYVTIDEATVVATARAVERFALVDADGDGVLSDGEQAAGREAAREMRRARMGCMMEQRGSETLLD